MFRDDLLQRFKVIFKMRHGQTFDKVGETYEQDKIFIEITAANCKVTQDKQLAKVEGNIVVYSQDNKLPFGFFNKKIETAPASYKHGLFFYDFDVDVANSPARLQNIHERRTSFVFLYSSQYDPSKGTLTSVDFGG